MKQVKQSRIKPVSTAKRPDRLIRNGGVGNGQAPAYLRYVALGVLVVIAVVIVGGIATVGLALA